MPSIRSRYFILSLALIVMGSVLASCSRSTPGVSIYKKSPADIAIDHEVRVIGITSQEIKKCYGNGVKNVYNSTIYPIIKEKSGKKRYCHVAFEHYKKTGRKYISVVKYDNYTYTACRMRVLKCIRPEAYKRIKEKYNVDEN
ncbi:MAG: hypothetical protein P8Y36_00165 [Alphaproteobacteria bacterium]